MTNRSRAFWATTALLTTMAASAAYAQETTGGIRGQIVDEAGAPLAGATVVALHAPTGTSATTMTDANGSYSFRNLRVGGPYQVTVSSSAYAAQTALLPSIGIGAPADLDILVSAGGEEGTSLDDIIVTGSATPAGLVTSPRSTFNENDIDTLPSISRDIRDFVRTSPFATTDPSNNDALSIGGQNTRYNAFLVDGIRQGDDFGLSSSGFPTVRSPISISVLEAVSVEVAPYDVQYGSFTGGVVNSVTKSGGNDFHGEVFYETTDQDMQGDTFTYEDFQTGTTQNRDLSASVFEETTWGATLTGPILQDRLFFVLNYEKYEATQPVLTGPSGSGAAVEVPGITQAQVDQVRQIAQTVYGFDPLGAVASELLTEDEKYFGKLDWNINDRHRAVVSYQQTEGSTLSLNGTSTSTSTPSVGLLSQAYLLESNLTAYKAQLFSDWTDRFSTELSLSRKEVENISSPLAGNAFAAMRIVLDPVGTAQRRSIILGPERSRHANQLTNDVDQFRFVGTYLADEGHTFTFGYEREQTDIFNVFVQFANAEYDFASLADFQARRASSIGYQNAASNNKNDGAAAFSYALNTLFFQDEWEVTPSLTINAGLRYDWYQTDDKPLVNPLFQSTYGFASDQTIDGISVLQPRFGFNWEATDSTTIYGGIGRFQGGSPNVWISNNYTNTGNLLGIFQCRRSTYTAVTGSPPAGFAACSAAEEAALNTVDGLAVNPLFQQRVTSSAGLGTGTINVIDPTFETPSIWKTSLGLVQELDFGRWGMGDGWTVRAEYVHSEVDNGVGWIDLNYERQRTQNAPDGRPTFFGNVTPAPGQSAAAAAAQTVLMLTNTEGGETDQFAISVSKDWYDGWAEGLGFNLSYTYLDSTEQNPGTSSVALSNYQQVAAIDPNNLTVSDSNYEIEDAIKLNLSYSRAFFGDYLTRINLFGQRRSGLNFSYAFATGANTLFGESVSQQRGLFYVPQTVGGQVTATSDPIVRFGPGIDLAAFNAYLQRTGLIEYAGQITPRNAFKSPDVTTFDLHLEQEIPAFFPGGARLSLYADIENIGNLLNDEWGVVQQLGFPFYSTDIEAVNCQVAGSACAAGIGNFYQYNRIAQDSASSFNASSVWQAKIGIRYSF
jgi:hypothetical protein